MATSRKPRNGNGDTSADARETRYRRRRKSKLGPTIVAGLFVAAGIVAAPLVWKKVQAIRAENDQIREHNRKEALKPAVTYEREALPEGTETDQYGRIIKRKSGKPERPVAVERSDAFNSLLQKGDTVFGETDFAAAADLYAQAMEEMAPAAMVETARQRAAAARLFAKTLEETKVEAESVADDLYVIKLRSGGELRGKKVGATADGIRFRSNNGITTVLTNAQIASMQRVTQDDQNAKMRQELVKAKTLAEEDGISQYLLGVTALEMNFPDEAKKLFLKAASIDSDIAQAVVEYKARKIFAAGAWYHSVGNESVANRKFAMLQQTYPESQAAQLAREIKDEMARKLAEAQQKGMQEERETQLAMMERDRTARRGGGLLAQVTQAAKDGGDGEGDVAPPRAETADRNDDAPEAPAADGESSEERKGDSLFAEGMDLFSEAQSCASARKSTKLYKKALKIFDKAMSLYEKAKRTGKASASIDDKLQKANMKLYWCRKLQRLG